jgi:hypothetical protein
VLFVELRAFCYYILDYKPDNKHSRQINLNKQILNFQVTVKTGVSFRHLLRHRNSASSSVILTLKSVCLRLETTLLSVKTTLRLSYRVFEMTLLNALFKSHSKVSKRHSKGSKRHSKCHFQHSIR